MASTSPSEFASLSEVRAAHVPSHTDRVLTVTSVGTCPVDDDDGRPRCGAAGERFVRTATVDAYLPADHTYPSVPGWQVPGIAYWGSFRHLRGVEDKAECAAFAKRNGHNVWGYDNAHHPDARKRKSCFSYISKGQGYAGDSTSTINEVGCATGDDVRDGPCPFWPMPAVPEVALKFEGERCTVDATWDLPEATRGMDGDDDDVLLACARHVRANRTCLTDSSGTRKYVLWRENHERPCGCIRDARRPAAAAVGDCPMRVGDAHAHTYEVRVSP